MLIRSAPSAWAIPAITPGRSGTWTRSRCSAPGVLVGGLEQPPPVRGGLADPAREEAGVAGRERRLDLLDPPPVLGERRRQRRAVLEEDVDPDARVRAGDAGHVAQRATGRGERLVAVDARAARLVQEHVRECVRQVARDRDEPVVRLRIDRDRHRPERRDEAVQRPCSCRARSRRPASGTRSRRRTARRSPTRARAPRSRRSDGRRRSGPSPRRPRTRRPSSSRRR